MEAGPNCCEGSRTHAGKEESEFSWRSTAPVGRSRVQRRRRLGGDMGASSKESDTSSKGQ